MLNPQPEGASDEPVPEYAGRRESIGNDRSALWRALRKQGATNVKCGTFNTQWKQAEKRWDKYI